LSKINKEWERKQAYFEYSGSKLYLRPQTPFKNRLQRAANKLEAQSQLIEEIINRLNETDKQLFSKMVDFYSTHNAKRANVYANELAELRKTIKNMMNAKLILEKTALRLSTVHQLGDAIVILAPSIKDLQNTQTGIKNILPSSNQELSSICDMLNHIISESGQSSGINLNIEVPNEGSTKILEEAAMVAELKMKNKLPDTPAHKNLTDKSLNKETEA
jgi:division protein CdvB (Snf7/Vps24/ESCRT-III family)